MSNYKVKCTDLNGDIMKVILDGTKADIDCSKFTRPINSEKIKRLVDSIQGVHSLLEDFGFIKLEVELVEEE